MAIVKKEIEIQSTCEQVWTTVTDFKRMPTWFYGVKRVSVLSAELGTGTERSVTVITGQSYREKIDHWDTNKFFSYVVIDPPTFIAEWAAFISLKPTLSSVILLWEIHYAMKYGVLGKIVDSFFLAPIIDKILLLSLKKFKSIMEKKA